MMSSANWSWVQVRGVGHHNIFWGIWVSQCWRVDQTLLLEVYGTQDLLCVWWFVCPRVNLRLDVVWVCGLHQCLLWSFFVVSKWCVWVYGEEILGPGYCGNLWGFFRRRILFCLGLRGLWNKRIVGIRWNYLGFHITMTCLWTMSQGQASPGGADSQATKIPWLARLP